MTVGTANKLVTPETKKIEKLLGSHFDRVEAYRFNSVSIRVRIFDRRFRGTSKVDRHQLVEPFLDQLPERTQQDIVFLLLLAPEEEEKESGFASWLMNDEFENPRPSSL